jgi:hypothetical protein
VELFFRTVRAFERLSPSMQNCWFDFLMRFKCVACSLKSDSSHMAESYLLCCIAGMEFSTNTQCLPVLMDVLKVYISKLEEPQLHRVALWLCCISKRVQWDLQSSESSCIMRNVVSGLCPKRTPQVPSSLSL